MRRTLLLVGQKEVRDLLSRFFALNGVEVERVENGEAAICLVKEKHYDLLVGDFLMPQRDGLDLTKKLKSAAPDLSILIICESGVGEAFFREAGADGFLTKPLDFSGLKVLVEEILGPKK